MPYLCCEGGYCSQHIIPSMVRERDVGKIHIIFLVLFPALSVIHLSVLRLGFVLQNHPFVPVMSHAKIKIPILAIAPFECRFYVFPQLYSIFCLEVNFRLQLLHLRNLTRPSFNFLYPFHIVSFDKQLGHLYGLPMIYHLNQTQRTLSI